MPLRGPPVRRHRASLPTRGRKAALSPEAPMARRHDPRGLHVAGARREARGAGPAPPRPASTWRATTGSWAAPDLEDDMGASRYDRRMRWILAFGKAHGLPRERTHIQEGKLVDALEEMSSTMNADLYWRTQARPSQPAPFGQRSGTRHSTGRHRCAGAQSKRDGERFEFCPQRLVTAAIRKSANGRDRRCPEWAQHPGSRHRASPRPVRARR